MDQSLWQTPESIDFIYSSHEWIQTILSLWEILPNNADWDCFRTLTLRENHVWIQNFRRSNWKITMLGKSAYLFVVLWHGRSCQEMCRKVLWVGEQNDSTTLQSINSMHWRRSFQRRRIDICRKIVESIISNCSEMLKLGTYWKTRYSMVSEKTCAVDHNMDQSLWQAIESFDLLHSSHKRIHQCHVWNTAKQADWDCFKTPILREIPRTQNLLQVEHYAFLEVIRLSQ